MNKEQLLTQWSEMTKISLPAINEIYDKSYKEIKSKNPTMTPKDLEVKALEASRMAMKKKVKTKGTKTDMFVLGVFVQDDSKKIIEEGTKIWKDNPEVAMSKGFTNSEGEPLFTAGYRKGDVAPPHAFRVSIVGIDKEGNRVVASYNKDSDKIGVEGWKDLPSKIDTFSWYNFPLTKAKKDVMDYACYYINGDISFDKLRATTKEDIAMAKKVFGKDDVKISGLEEFKTRNDDKFQALDEKNKSKSNFDSYALVSGNITSIKLPKQADGNGNIEMDDGSLELVVDEFGNISGSVTGWTSSVINIDVEVTGEPIPAISFMRIGRDKNKKVRTSLGGFYVKDQNRSKNVEETSIEPSPPISEDEIDEPQTPTTEPKPQTPPVAPPTKIENETKPKSLPENKPTSKEEEEEWF